MPQRGKVQARAGKIRDILKFQQHIVKPGRASVRAYSGGPMKRSIVIADDDPTIVSLVSLRLGLARFNVFGTGDATAAVAMVHAREPVAVILDVQMPGGGGLSALRKIKSDPQMKNLPVMMLTGERDAETVVAAMSSGANDYMVKPFDPDTLLEQVSRLVKSSAMVWGAPAPASVPAAVWEL